MHAGTRLQRPVSRYMQNLFMKLPFDKLQRHVLSDLAKVPDVVNAVRANCPHCQEQTLHVVPQDEQKETPELSADCLLRCLKDRVFRAGRPLPVPGAIGKNIKAIGQLLGLNPVELSTLRFLLLLNSEETLVQVAEAFGPLSLEGAAKIVALAIDEQSGAVVKALHYKGRLLASGLVRVEERPHHLDGKIALKAGLIDAIHCEGLTREELVDRFLSTAPPPTLNWDDFAHLRDEVACAKEVLRAALRSQRAGINVLFYGETGTGKTELSRLIAQELGAPIYCIGHSNSDGESAAAAERLSSLMLGNQLVRDGTSLLLFDEFEDVFSWGMTSLVEGRGALGGSKQWLNLLLETNPVPTVWITNKARIDPAYLRRFSCVLEFRAAGQRQRARVLARHLGEDSDLTTRDIDAVAQQFHSSPAQLATAISVAKMNSPDNRVERGALERILAPVERLITGVDPLRRPIFDMESYQLDALNSSADLVGIAERLAAWKPSGRAGLSLCLYGPPGTGKSEYAKYLAHRMGRPLVVARASDLLNCFVGGTEKNIANVFRDAEDNDALLLLDEVDSLLRDRKTAQRSWEVTEVNELLQQLESFRGVVVCTTNLWGNIDEAALRRFIFKLEFRYLRPAQALALFDSMFKGRGLLDAGVAAQLAGLSQLTPGDFAAVARQERASGVLLDARALVAALEAEVRVKPGVARPAGFAASS